MANLSAIDGFVLVTYLLGSVCLGMWLGRGQQDAKRYLLGGNQAPWWAILGSIVATETSTVTFLSVPGITFADGGDFRFLQLAIGYIVGRVVIVFWLLPLYFRGELFTVYQLLRQRFGGPTQKLASLIFLATRNLGDGLRLFLTAIVLETTLGWPLAYCVAAIGTATIVFTFFGGMQSVIWNDCIQLTVYLSGGLLVFFLICFQSETGLAGVFDFARDTGRLRMLDFPLVGENGVRFDETYTFWAGLIGGAFLTLGTHGTDQMFVQRALAARSHQDAGRALICSGVVIFFQFALFLLVGVALASFYSGHPPERPFDSGDRVLSTYIVHEIPKGIGLVGILLAAIFSAAMSTLSSSLNSSATAVVTDWIIPTQRALSDANIVLATKLLTICFGILQIAIGIWAADFDDAVITNALAIAGFSSGLLLGLFAIGTCLDKANQTAAVVGLGFGLTTLVALKFGIERLPTDSPWSYQVAWPWLPVIGAASTFGAGWSVSLVTRNAADEQTRT